MGQLLISDSNFRRSFLVPAYITGHVPLNKVDMDNYDDLLTNTTWTKGTSISRRCEINPGDLYGRLIFVAFLVPDDEALNLKTLSLISWSWGFEFSCTWAQAIKTF